MKALIVTTQAQPETTDRNYVRIAIAGLKASGITYRRSFAEALTLDQINSYDLVVVPKYVGEATIETWIDNVNVTVPFFLLGNQSGSAGFGLTPGISGGLSGNADQFFSSPVSTSLFMVAFAKWAVLTDGTPIVQSSALDALSGGAQAQAGMVAAWSSGMAGGSRFYAMCNPVSWEAWLPLLISVAITENELALPPRKAPVFLDLDHPNGGGAAPAIPSTIDNFMRFVPAGGVVWGGLDDASSAFTTMPADTRDALIKWQATGKLKLSEHHHSVLPTAGLWPNVTDVRTKLQEETLYDANEALINGLGLTYNQPGHYNPANNSWHEGTLELFSPDVSKASDGANAISKAGKGFRTIRNRATSHRSSVPQAIQYNNLHAVKQMMRGMLIIPCHDPENDTAPHSTIAEWRDNFRAIMTAVNSGMVLYLHDDDFVVADQDPGVNKHGAEFWGMIREMHDYGLAKFWANPVDYHGVRNFV